MGTPLDHISLPVGTRLFSEGEPGDNAYLIRSGEIEIVVERDGREFVIARRGPGEIIGEMALLDGGPRSATARVVVPIEVIAISLRQLEQRIANTDPILRMCLGVVIERYRETLKFSQIGEGPRPTARVSVTERASISAKAVGQDFRAAVELLTLEREIAFGLAHGEFEIFLQPIVALGDRSLAGFEALIRWNHPVRGLMLPAHFIAVAESSGLILQLTEWVLRETIRIIPKLLMAAAPPAAGEEPLFVSVNVSGHDLVQPEFAETIKTILREGLVDPRHLKLEITESMLMKDPDRAGRILEACREHGMGIAVDDFGTGYSSLSYLSTLPITKLKIDRCFVKAMTTDPTSRKIVNTIRFLARELNIPVVAEGIESEAEAMALEALKCEYGQGYLFGRPMPASDALLLLRAHSARDKLVEKRRA